MYSKSKIYRPGNSFFTGSSTVQPDRVDLKQTKRDLGGRFTGISYAAARIMVFFIATTLQYARELGRAIEDQEYFPREG